MSDLYDTDFYAWTNQQAALLRAGRLSAADVVNIAEEIESMGKSERRELASRLEVLLTHLLKWQFQPDGSSGSWRGSIAGQRRRIADLLDESPSLRPALPALAAGTVDKMCDGVGFDQGRSFGGDGRGRERPARRRDQARLRRAAARPPRPRPSTAMEAGSGTAGT